MAKTRKPDFNEVRTEGWQFWKGLETAGKFALGLVVAAVLAVGWIAGRIHWPF